MNVYKYHCLQPSAFSSMMYILNNFEMLKKRIDIQLVVSFSNQSDFPLKTIH